jgi:phosphoglycerate dehydrogenase-like enzyme
MFETEPLAQDHPFQTHPEVNVTSDIASQTIAFSAAAREHIDRAAGT